MSRAARLFDLVQILRNAGGPVRAADLASQLEVDPRTIYRDIASLKARRVPVDGAPGIGYILRPGFEFPPLVLTPDEMEAMLIGAQLLRRTGDRGLRAAARGVIEKIKAMSPGHGADWSVEDSFYVSGYGAPDPSVVDMAKLRRAIRDCRKLRIDYIDENETKTLRTVQPVGISYYIEVTLVHAWCELRKDYRTFRTDRVTRISFLKRTFARRSDIPRLQADS
ncbi:MAG: HTH domain-containing protein [Alphaproteobacteria bacterium]|nr:HTH domain-containing protein [Alphaproteobacteria bacterium]